MSKLNPERGTFSNIPHRTRPEFYPSLHVRVGMGSHQPGFLYTRPGGDIIHDDDLEEVVLHTPRTPPIRPAPQVYQNQMASDEESSCLTTKVMIGNIKFPLSVFIILAIVLTALSVCAIIVHDRYNDRTCIGSYGGIMFGYVKWLYIYAWTNIGLIGCMIWLFVISRFSSVKVNTLKLNILRLGYLFQFAWYIVGAILYFIEVNKSCSSGDILYDFGLVLFICQSIALFTILFQDRTT